MSASSSSETPTADTPAAEPDGEVRSPAAPLAGVLVIDATRHLPGPLCARLLADLGARVIKLEEPGAGDPVRQAIPRLDGRSSLAALLLSGHQSLAIDLKAPDARASVEQLLSHADVLLESFRPGTLERLGLAPRELRQRFPALVICSLSGWGQSGPYAERAGHDLTYQAVAGTLASRPQMPATQTADMIGGWSAATSVIAALYRRRIDGQGCWIDQALLDAAAHANLTGWAGEADGAKEVGQPLLLTGALPIYGLYRTADRGYLALGTLEIKFWRRFCEAAGRPDLVRLPLRAGAEEASRQIAELIAGRSRRQWNELCVAHDLPVEVVLSCREALAHPQVAHRQLLRDAADGLPRLGFPALFDGVRPRGAEHVPDLGEHSRALVEEFDLLIAASSKRRAGIGRRFSLRGWAERRLTGWFGKRRL